MFWGLIVLQNKKYTQTVEKTFRVTQASLDPKTRSNEHVQVILGCDEKLFLLCTLRPSQVVQAPLNLLISKGETISFSSKGDGIVHLTGYVECDWDEDNESDDGLNAADGKVNMKIAKKSRNNLILVNDNEDSDDSDDSDYKIGSNVTKDDDDESDDNSDNDENDKDGSDNKENDDDDDDDDDDEAADDDDEEADDDKAAVNDESADDDDDDDDDDDLSESEDEVGPVAKRPKIDVNQKSKKNGLSKKDDKKDKKPMIQQDQKKENKKLNQQQPSKRIISGGIQIEDLRVGNGKLVKNGQNVRVYYEGRLESNNKMFDSALRGPGFTFKLGNGDVIKGWELGVLGMAVGGKRRLVIPSNLGYGIKGEPPVIPPNSNLIFEIEVRHVY